MDVKVYVLLAIIILSVMVFILLFQIYDRVVVSSPDLDSIKFVMDSNAGQSRSPIIPIFSMSTTPSRASSIPDSVSHLQSHIPSARLIINVPDKFGRTGEEYPDMSHAERLDGVYINHCGEDLGPVTKLLPSIKYVKEHFGEVTHIITTDGDMTFEPGYVQTLINAVNKAPSHTIVGMADVMDQSNMARPETTVASGGIIHEGFALIAYPVSVFSDAIISRLMELRKHKECFKSDDMTLAMTFHEQGVMRVSARDIISNSFTEYPRENMSDMCGGESQGADALHVLQNHYDTYQVCARHTKIQ